MAKYISNRQQNLKIGIVSYTENQTVLEVTGNVGIGTTDSGGRSLYVIGDGQFDGNLKVTGIATFGTGTIIVDGNNNIITVGTGVTISSIDGIDAPSIRVDTLNTDNLFVTGITTLASNGGITTTGGNLYVGQNLEVAGTSNLIGDITLRGGNIAIGDTITDTINVGGEFVSKLVPSDDDIFDLGMDEKRWRNARFSGLTTTTDLYVSGIGTIATLDTTNGTIDYLSGTNVYYSGISTFGITNITVNSSSNALTIDQDGTGNALVVQPDINGFVVTGIGSVGVGVANPGEALQVSGNIRIGTSDSNYIAFRGTTGDILNGGFNHTFIGERIYTPGTEESELFIFKGNDHDLSGEGPDRIRLAAAEFRFDTYTTPTWGSFESVATSPNLSTKFIVRDNGFVGVGTANPLTTLDVNGGFNVSGVGTIATLDTTTGTIDYLSGANLSYSGIGTIATLDTTAGTIDYLSGANLSYSGIGTIETLDTTTGTIDYLSNTNLNTSGVGTIATLDTTTGTIDYLSGTNISYSGIGTIETLDVTTGTIDFLTNTNLNTSGIGTIETLDTTTGTIDFLSNTNLNTSGIGTIATLDTTTGTIDYLSGTNVSYSGIGTIETLDTTTGTIDYLTNTNFNTSGIGTIETLDTTTGTIDYLENTNINSSGIITATQFSTGPSDTAINITNNTISGPEVLIIDPHPVGVGTTSGIVRIKGDLYVDGTEFIVNSTTIEFADFNVGIATTIGTNFLLDGAGIGIGSTNIRKTLTYDYSSDSLKSSENFDLSLNKVYKINETEVLSSTQLTVPNIYSIGIGTIETLDTTVGNIDYLSGTNVFYSGIATLGIATISELYVSGVSTFVGVGTFSGDLYVGGDLYINNELFLNNLTLNNLNVTGIGTIATLDTTTGTIDYLSGANLSYSGIGTIETLDTTTGTIDYLSNTNLNTSGIGTIATLDTTVGTIDYLSNTNLNTSGIGTIETLDTTVGTIDHLSGTNVSYSGIGTIETLDTTTATIDYLSGTNVSYSGIGTIETLDVTTGTIDFLSNTNLNVSGVSTFVGVGTFSGDLYVGGDLYVADDITFDSLNANSINVSGIGTIETLDVTNGTIDFLSNTDLNTSGIGTIETLDTTTGTIDFLSNTNLNTSGIGTIETLDTTTGTIDFLSNTNIDSSGIITATQFSTGPSSTSINITTDTISGPEVLIIDPHPVGVGTTSGIVRIKGDLYVDGTEFVVNSTTIELADFNVGIATTIGTNFLLDGAGIGIGSTNIRKTLTYDYSSDSLKSSENFDLESDKVYKINEVEVLSYNQLTVPNIYAIGIGTIETLDTTTATIDYLSGTNVSYSGIGTIETLDTTTATIDYLTNTNFNTSGIGTIETLDVTTGTIDYLSNTNLNTSGIGTIETLDVTTGTIDFLSNTNLNVSGIATLGIVTSNQLYVSGVVTATTFYGNLVGIATTALNLNRDVNAGSGLGGGGTLTSDVTLEVNIGTGITISSDSVALKNGDNLTDGRIVKWDDGNSQLTNSIVTDTGTNIGIGSTQPTSKLQVIGNIEINSTTVTGSATSTLSTILQTSIHSGLSTSAYRFVEYTIQATEGTNFQCTKVLALHDDITAYHTEYGTVYNNTPVASFDVNISGGNLVLLATGSSASTTNYVINFIATKV